MNQHTLLTLYRAMYTARQIDKVEQELTQRGEAFFHVAGSGHEATAALAPHLTEADWLHCHYRDKALLVARGMPIREFLDSFLCKERSASHGRRMSGFYSDPGLHILSMVTPTGNNALQAVGVAAAVKDDASRPIVYCGIGDGTTQQGEVTEAIAAAVRDRLPVLFNIEDNRLAISTSTRGRTFISLPDGDAESYYGLPIQRVDGIVERMRRERTPQLVVFSVERLTSHTNADDHRVYRTPEEIRDAAITGDPLTRLEHRLLAEGCEAKTLAALRRNVESEIATALDEASAGSDPTPHMSAKAVIPVELTHASYEVRGDEKNATLTMGQALRNVLDHQLATDPRVFLYGEDIEDPKGDVFGVTRGLSTKYGGRVCNSPLSESTIIGTSIGLALAGQRPVAFIQFADFLPPAYNQLTCELASMFWRTGGGWKAPVVVMAACGGYRPGLGPYHAQTYESVMSHTPGIDVFMPSNACDAAGMLNAAFKSERPSLILYPKAMLNDVSRATSPNVAEQFVPIGSARKLRTGRDITFVAWGNTVSLCERAADDLERAGVEVEIIDLRSLSPWDEHMVVASVEKTSRLIVVHEDNHTCGFGGEVLATVGEKSRFPVSMRRITRPDTFIPCHYGSQLEVMPSYQRVLSTAAQLLDFDLTWEQPTEQEAGMFDLLAIGSAPSDETVTVVEFLTQVGARLEKGDVVASVEAAKSVFEMTTSVGGEVAELLAAEGDSIAVGKPLMRIRTDDAIVHKNAVLLENPGEPILIRRRPQERLPLPKRY
ncbi:MAG: transketolase, partial [Planctomycetia bacterium]|nr:transketolase [Planctomycetia bacterium]